MARTPRDFLGETPRPHLVCFHCRKTFKPSGGSDPANDLLRAFPCPDCKRTMVRLGRYFQAPPRHASRHWLKVELLHAFGETFDESRDSRGHRGSFNSLRDAIEHLVLDRHVPEQEVRDKLAQMRRSLRPNRKTTEPRVKKRNSQSDPAIRSHPHRRSS